MNWFGQAARQRQQTVVRALRTPAPPLATSVTQTGPLPPSDPAHPGSLVYPYKEFTIGTHEVRHWRPSGPYTTLVTYMIPVGFLPFKEFPLIVVSPDLLFNRLDYYAALLRHICLKGYVVLFVNPATGPQDDDYPRQAADFLEAVHKTLAFKVGGRVASPPQLAWWGHSTGAKVQALAAGLTGNRYYLRPTAIIANNFSNAGQGNALTEVAAIPPEIWYTIIEGDQDIQAGTNPQQLYEALAGRPHRQLITAVSYPVAHLLADHYSPLTAAAPGLAEGAGQDALDWWLYWKVAVGAFDYHFKDGPAAWAYGDERENGGTDLAGQPIRHKVNTQ